MSTHEQQCAPVEPNRRPIRAAQYVRMSTEHQQYSTENQMDVVAEYARKRGFEIVKTYADGGKSGLRIEWRDALTKLIEDVQSGRADFETILVYDVSRWGRFQDTDESAYYEYICKRAGVHVAYCAEQFENDGSPSATIIKSVKRAMAAEYSRELSSKVFKGQCKLIELGYRQGGTAGYGLRRMLIDHTGQSKGILKRGEHKSLQTDRVILVPGPPEEIAVVHRIYELLTGKGMQEQQIAELLNEEGLPGETGGPWTRGMVHEILTNEKYIGNNVYNHVSFKLKKKRVQNPPEMWVRNDGAFESIVDPLLFFTARGMILERNRRFSDEQMIELLRNLVNTHTDLSSALIDDTDGMPSSAAYRTRFGTLLQAYRLAGYVPDRDYTYLEINRRLREVRPELVADVIRKLQGAGATVLHDSLTDTLTINDEYRVAIVLSRCMHTTAGAPRWRAQFDQDRPPDITVMVRMDSANSAPADFYLLPHLDLGLSRLLLRESNHAEVDTYRFPNLAHFVAMAERRRIEVAA